MPAGIKANSDGSAAIQVGGSDVITLTSGGAATFLTSPTTVQAGTAAAPSITFSGDTNTGIYSPGADQVTLVTGGAAAITISSGQRSTFPTTIGVGAATPSTSGSGISFPATQSASTDANTLDDYEEGDWTPSVGGTATYTARYGKYTKIGNVVTCQFKIQVNVIGTGSTNQLQGFPFVAANIADVQSGGCSFFDTLAVNTSWLSFYIENNATTAQFVGQNAFDGSCANAIGLFGNSTQVYGSITYRVA